MRKNRAIRRQELFKRQADANAQGSASDRVHAAANGEHPDAESDLKLEASPPSYSADGNAEGMPLVNPVDTATDPTKRTVLGYVNFDSRSTDGDSTVLIDNEFIRNYRRGSYVEVESRVDKSVYLGRLVDGPFFSPDYVSIDSSIARLAIQKAELLGSLPDYHASGSVEILGLMQKNGSLSGHSTRPLPQSVVYTVGGEALVKLLNLEGSFALGRLDSYDEILVNIDETSKKVIPRNIGIFGTVGSGKTNTSQVLIEEASRLGWAVVILDVEGEYIEMNKPTEEPAMLARLKHLGIKPGGIDDFAVYHPVNCEADEEVRSKSFSITFGHINPYMVTELLGMNDTQEDRFLQAYEACVRKPVASPRTAPKARKSKKSDDAEPIVEIIDELISSDNHAANVENRFGTSIIDLMDDETTRDVTLQQLIDRISLWLDNDEDDVGRKLSYRNSWEKVRSQLLRLQRLKLFDTSSDALDANELMKPGKVSVINLSDSLEPRVNNLVIADVLGRIFKFKLSNQDPHAIIIIEEAHTFVSKENVRRMEATMEKLREIARRGRKRWLGLTFISQQPSHLPQELYELCNNLFIHETKGHKNVDALKSSAGAINEGIWRDVPTLGQGRAIVVSPQFKHPVVTLMNPSRSKRRLTD